MIRLPRTLFWIAWLSLGCSAGQAQRLQSINVAFPYSESVERIRDGSFSFAVSSSLVGLPSTNTNGFIRPVPAPAPAEEVPSYVPFRSGAIAFTGGTLGTGVEFATPFSRRFDLRSSVNILAFGYPLAIDGVTYNFRLDQISTTSSFDWFPGRTSFHVSPGILYTRSSLDALVSVAPGQGFELGSQAFVNSVNDPLNGTANLIFPHRLAPMIMVGFGDVIPHKRHRYSFPVEIGVAYTGAPVINVALNGTACTAEGCVKFQDNADTQSSLAQEIGKLNEDLKRLPVYPIVSAGFSYHF